VLFFLLVEIIILFKFLRQNLQCKSCTYFLTKEEIHGDVDENCEELEDESFFHKNKRFKIKYFKRKKNEQTAVKLHVFKT